jgi:hypothetical protein
MDIDAVKSTPYPGRNDGLVYANEPNLNLAHNASVYHAAKLLVINT